MALFAAWVLMVWLIVLSSVGITGVAASVLSWICSLIPMVVGGYVATRLGGLRHAAVVGIIIMGVLLVLGPLLPSGMSTLDAMSTLNWQTMRARYASVVSQPTLWALVPIFCIPLCLAGGWLQLQWGSVLMPPLGE
jgi:hypothetical protein